MPEQYLKCEYYGSEEGTPVIELRPDEYVITFRVIDGAEVIGLVAIIDGEEWPGKNRDWCIADKEQVISLDKSEGLVKLAGLKMDEKSDSALAGIVDLGDGRVSYFTVPLDELVVK